MKIHQFKLYPERDDIFLTAYISENEIVDKKKPAIIICPGGAYVFLSPREGEPIALEFLSKGYQVFVLHYSVITKEENYWPDDISLSKLPSRKPEVEYPSPIIELGKAFLLINEYADKWSIDINQIGICGFSAGGHNCAMYSGLWHSKLLTDSLKTNQEKLKPAFCILGYPFIDFYAQSINLMSEETRDAYKWMYLDYFGEVNPSEGRLKEASANYIANELNPPTFIWSTACDKSVPIQHSLNMAQALTKKNVPFEIHIFEQGVHGLALSSIVSASNQDEIREDVAKWVDLADVWLKKHIHYDLEEK